MTEEKNIKDIIEGKSADEALAAVERALADNPHNAMMLVEKGKLLWRLNRRGDRDFQVSRP